MSWDELQILGTTLFSKEIASITSNEGDAVLRERLASLSRDERGILRRRLRIPSVSDRVLL
jgi:hypothetical protein